MSPTSPTPLEPGQIGILVAPFPSDIHSTRQNTYADTIRSLVSDTLTLRDVVKVRLLGCLLPEDPQEQHDEAVRLGGQFGDSYVIRSVREGGVSYPWLSVVEQAGSVSEHHDLGAITGAEVVEILNGPVPPHMLDHTFYRRYLSELDMLRLPSEFVVLARCILALCYYRHQLYRQAITHFTEIVEDPALGVDARVRPYLTFLLGNCYWFLRSADPAGWLQRAIAAYDEALREWAPSLHFWERVRAINNRGNAHYELPGPDRAANLREALRCFYEVLDLTV